MLLRNDENGAMGAAFSTAEAIVLAGMALGQAAEGTFVGRMTGLNGGQVAKATREVEAATLGGLLQQMLAFAKEGGFKNVRFAGAVANVWVDPPQRDYRTVDLSMDGSAGNP
jgi:NaMN:DMB phosphoribosyltransferase